jgi:hypothetical protein
VSKKESRVARDGKRVAFVGEAKATHSLRLPQEASDIMKQYKSALGGVRSIGERDTLWSNVAHPLGQLFGYMRRNNCCYGALTSGSRTYFVRIEGLPGKIRISDAWLVGQKNYLRAWAYILDKAYTEPAMSVELQHSLDGLLWQGTPGADDDDDEQEDDDDDDDKEQDSKDNDDDEGKHDDNDEQGDEDNEGKHDGDDEHYETDNGKEMKPRKRHRVGRVSTPPHGGTAGTKHAQLSIHPDPSTPKPYGKIFRCCESALDPILPLVSRNDFQLQESLGFGKNGTVFKALWAGQEVAVKIFDLDKQGKEAYRSETFAYARLQDSWGILVPKPLFLSQTNFGIVLMYLGLQLGKPFTKSDEASWAERRKVVSAIRKHHGIRLLDDDHEQNFLLLTAKNGVDNVVAIDLEDHEDAEANKKQ